MALQPYTITTQKASPYQNIIEEFTRKEAAAGAANLARQKEIEAIYDKIISMYGPGGTYGAGMEEQLRTQKVRDVGVTAQRDISRGMYGIRPYEQEWESAIGAPARLKLEDIKTERLSSALGAKAGFEERIEQPYPDYGALMQGIQAGYGGEGGGVSGTTGQRGIPSQFGGYSQWKASPAEMSYGSEYAASMAEKSAAAEDVQKSMGGQGAQTITIWSGNVGRTGQPIGTSKTISIPAGMTGIQAMEKGLIPKGWSTEKTGTNIPAQTTKQMKYTSGGSFGGGYTYQ